MRVDSAKSGFPALPHADIALAHTKGAGSRPAAREAATYIEGRYIDVKERLA